MKMKKYILLLTIIAIFLNGCEEKSFEYDLYDANINDIDSVGFSTGAYRLIADGHATLKFHVDAYRSVKYEAENKSRMILINPRSLPKDIVKVLDENGTEVGLEYSTTKMGSGTKIFHAEINNISSINHSVILREPQILPSKLYVDVIFHVCELSATDKEYDPMSYKNLDPALLGKLIVELNEVFNNKLYNSPNGASANIEFRLATKYNGVAMNTPGYHLITFDASWKVKPTNTSYLASDFITKFDATPATYIWDPNQYLNVYIYTSASTTKPPFQVVPDGKTSMPGMGTVITKDKVNTVPQTVANCGVHITPVSFQQYYTLNRINATNNFANYYGLYNTEYGTTVTDDYCFDTMRYPVNNIIANIGIVKVDRFGNKFITDNATQVGYYNYGLKNTFTLDQVNRIRYAIENCPLRKNGKTQ